MPITKASLRRRQIEILKNTRPDLKLKDSTAAWRYMRNSFYGYVIEAMSRKRGALGLDEAMRWATEQMEQDLEINLDGLRDTIHFDMDIEGV